MSIPEGYAVGIGASHVQPNITFRMGTSEVMRIEVDGRIFWKGREVESDDDFRAAMIDVRHALVGQY